MIEGPIYFDYTDSGPGSGLALNVRTCFDSAGAWQPPYYWYRVTAVDGLWDEDVNFEVHTIPQQNRARSGDAYTGGKTLVIAGRIEAQNIGYLRGAQAQLKVAFQDMAPHNLYFRLFTAGLDGSAPDWVDLYFNGARKNQKIDMPEQQLDLTPRRPFVVQLWVDDPKMYPVGGSSSFDLFTS